MALKFNPFTGSFDNDTDNQTVLDGRYVNTSGDTMTGNLTVSDASSPTKAYRFRVTGSSLDLEAGGADIFLSTWSNADFTGDQHFQIVFDSGGGVMDFRKGLTVQDGNSVGIGATPTTRLHVEGGALRVNGEYDESTTNQGVYVGRKSDDNTPRIMFANGTASQNWQIDNNGGSFRWYLPLALRMTLTDTQLRVERGGLFNNSAGDYDFQVKGDSDDNMIYGDASTGRVGIGVAAPNNKLEVNGTAQVDGLQIDQTPTAETPTATHTATINLNGTNYKFLCVAA